MMKGLHSYTLFLSIALLAGAWMWFQQERPAAGEPKDFTLPEKTTLDLDNGIKVTLVPFGRTPKVAVNVVIRTGGIDEDEGQTWLTHLTLAMLREGTQTKTAREIAELAANMGGEIGFDSGMDQSLIGAEVLSEFGPAMVQLLADLIRNPLFPKTELERLKNDLIRDLSIAKTKARSIAEENFRRILYKSHPYGRVFPTEEELKSISLEDLKKHYTDNFGGLRTHIFIVGRFDQGLMESAIRMHFDSWQKGAPPTVNLPVTKREKSTLMLDKAGTPQSTIYMGLPVIAPGHKDYTTLLVADALLGGAFISRITTNIREDKGYTYNPRSRISPRYRDAFWIEVADIAVEHTGDALNQIYYEIYFLHGAPPEEPEITNIKNYVSGGFVLRNSNRFGIIGQLAFMDLHGLGDDFLQSFVKSVHAVTPKDVQRVTQENIQVENLILIVVGDQRRLKKQMAALP